MKKIPQIIILTAALFFFLFGCKPPEKTAPDFPPESDITIDFSYFVPPSADGNYAHAYQISSYWASLLSDSLDLYNSMINTIGNNELQYQDYNTWLINRMLNLGENQYDINYFEIVHSDSVETKMFFSLDSTYNNLILFDGYFFTDSTTGFRQINKPDTSNTYLKFLKIDWNIISENDKEIKFSNTLLNNSRNGNFVFYKDSVDSNYNVFMDFFEKASDNHTYIEYNKANLSGRVKDEPFFGDTDWHCWDENRADIDCPLN